MKAQLRWIHRARKPCKCQKSQGSSCFSLIQQTVPATFIQTFKLNPWLVLLEQELAFDWRTPSFLDLVVRSSIWIFSVARMQATSQQRCPLLSLSFYPEYCLVMKKWKYHFVNLWQYYFHFWSQPYRIHINPVSYTHLTLPTIYSV